MLRLLMLFIALSLAACAFFGKSAGRSDPEKTNEAMITFVTKARAGFWNEAMEIVTPEERSDMMEDGKILPEYKEAVDRIRLSTIKNMDLSLDGRGRLVGLRDLLDESNNHVRRGEEEDKEKIDPSKLKDLEAERLKKEEEDKAKTKEIIEKESAEREKQAMDLLEGINIDDL